MANRLYFKGMTTEKNTEDMKAMFLAAGMKLAGFEFSEVACRVVPEDGVDIIVYISNDESEPYQIVSDLGEDEGKALDMDDESSVKALELLRAFGVCTEVYTVYPNSEKYGIPGCASDEDQARMLVSEHAFCTPEKNSDFEINQHDSGDDTPPRFWMRIKVPKPVHAELKI